MLEEIPPFCTFKKEEVGRRKYLERKLVIFAIFVIL